MRMDNLIVNSNFLCKPQWIMRNRLLKLGEKIGFTLYVPEGMEQGVLEVYPLFLENACLDGNSIPDSIDGWLKSEKSIVLDIRYTEGRYAGMEYLPSVPGNYLMKWTVEGEVLNRYFSVVEDDYTVINFSTFFLQNPEPTLHNLGIPLDYRLPAECFDPEDALYKKFLDYHRIYGDLIVCAFPDTPDINVDERVEKYGSELDVAKKLLPDQNDFRSIRVDMNHYIDRGYTETFKRLGIVDHCGLWEANGGSWLGMPEFIYYSSNKDCRKTDQSDSGSIIAHQWDFCAGFHFMGPVTWHYGSSGGNWEKAEECIRESLREAENSAHMSGHPAFIAPLYEGITPNQGYICPDDKNYDDGRLAEFIDSYKKFIAFDASKEFKIVFARSLDIADYYIKHYNVTPRTIYSSKTKHIMYDSWWQCSWTNDSVLAARERLPWLTKTSRIMEYREVNAKTKTPWNFCIPYKDSLSYEFLIIEDQKRSVRFERECPNPIWWFDYTDQTPYYTKGMQAYKKTPDVKITKSIKNENGIISINLQMDTDEKFDDYMIIIWDLPASIKNNTAIKVTNVKEYYIANNTDNEYHIVLVFDLKPGHVIVINWNET